MNDWGFLNYSKAEYLPEKDRILTRYISAFHRVAPRYKYVKLTPDDDGFSLTQELYKRVDVSIKEDDALKLARLRMDGLSYKEIAKVTGHKPINIKNVCENIASSAYAHAMSGKIDDKAVIEARAKMRKWREDYI